MIVIIGTSLTGAALQSPGAPLDKYPASMKLVVLVGNNLKPGWFEALVPALHRAHPELILLEPRLLSAIGAPAELPARVQNLLHAILPQVWSKGSPPVCQGLIRRQSPKAAAASRLYQRVFDPQRIHLDRLPLLEGLRADGIDVGVVDLPRADELEAAAPNLLQWRLAMRERLADKGFFFWHPPGEWPAVDYCDMAHFNHQGAVLFNDWLSTQLKQKFALTP